MSCEIYRKMSFKNNFGGWKKEMKIKEDNK